MSKNSERLRYNLHIYVYMRLYLSLRIFWHVLGDPPQPWGRRDQFRAKVRNPYFSQLHSWWENPHTRKLWTRTRVCVCLIMCLVMCSFHSVCVRIFLHVYNFKQRVLPAVTRDFTAVFGAVWSLSNGTALSRRRSPEALLNGADWHSRGARETAGLTDGLLSLYFVAVHVFDDDALKYKRWDAGREYMKTPGLLQELWDVYICHGTR